jgi:hypothetical protein
MDINCQNCLKKLAERENNTLSYNPSEINNMVQEITTDEVLITLQCPDCGCLLQIKS